MPELPEVETTLRGIAPHIQNQTIAHATHRAPVQIALDGACRFIGAVAGGKRARMCALCQLINQRSPENLSSRV